MNNMLLKLYVQFQNLMSREEGQDLVEYALVIAMLVLGTIASMRSMVTAISTEFSAIQTIFTSNV
jgi:pilus assembly protein Flp/PilA